MDIIKHLAVNIYKSKTNTAIRLHLAFFFTIKIAGSVSIAVIAPAASGSGFLNDFFDYKDF